MKPIVLAVTPGDPDGIGPEIVIKTIQAGFFSRHPHVRFLCVGAFDPFRKASLKYKIQHWTPDSDLTQKSLFFIAAPSVASKKANPGFQSGWSIETATHLVQTGICDALVTGPISKERLQLGGYAFSGHTDFLAHLCGQKKVTMMLANDQIRASLATVHTSLRSVPKILSREKIRTAATHTLHALRNEWGIARPKIAVLSLNPHAGEAGLFGDEEIKTITPEISALNRSYQGKASFHGPYPSDTFFALEVSKPKKKRFDAVLAMYHDQGLIPVKLLDFPHTVNVTLGLPMIRTSVDHGVAFDIAGKNVADASSFQSAAELALRLVQNSRKRKVRL